MADTPIPKELITKKIENLRSQRRNIINEIEKLESTGADWSDSPRTESLKYQHNTLIDQEEELNTQRLSDPLQILPPELWPDLLLGDCPGDLLILTLVSTRWRDGILSNPLLWRNITLNRTQGDYLSHAIMGLTLSAPLDINLQINISLKTWREIAPSIVAEGSRITVLSISTLNYNTRMAEALEMLSDFGKLSKLRDLTLPVLNIDIRPPLYIDELGWHLERTLFSVDELPLQNMPALLNIHGAIFNPRHLQMSSVGKFEKITIPSLKPDTVIALKDLPCLQHLCLTEEINPYTAKDIIPIHLYSSLSFVRGFNYCGLFLNRALPCIGSNLRTLEASYVAWNEFPDLLITLQSFPNLYQLDIDFCPWCDGLKIPVINVTPLPSVRSVRIGFSITPQFGDLSEESKLEHSETVDHLSRYLTSTFHCVRRFNISGQTLTAILAEYIQGLQHLQHVSFSTKAAIYEHPMSFTSPHLESVSWYYELPSNGMLDLLQSPSLLTVSLEPRNPFMVDEPTEQIYRKAVTPPRCTVPHGSIPNLRNLTLFVDYLRWDISPFRHLTALRLTGSAYGFSSGDIFEQLILKLTICPFLEEIGISQGFIEWDILIVLLERRNLASIFGVTRIKSIKLEQDIGYKLLRPLADLVNGRFPRRDSLVEYSIAAIGRLFWDKKIPGCVECLRTFRPCSILKGQPGYHIHEAETRFGLDNPSPLDPSSAHPPLTPEIAQWLSGRGSRLREYSEGAKLAVNKDFGPLERPFACHYPSRYARSMTITPHYLDGLSFENEFKQETIGHALT